ncbi:hypothetical protein KR044_010526, partial [Drosophila immigrans]
MKGSVVLLLVAAISLGLIATAEGSDFRLSRSVLPSFYNLTINIQSGRWSKLGSTFIGEVAITLQANQKDIYEITLHKDSLDISSCLIYNYDGLLQQNVSIASLKYDRETQKLTVPLLDPLPVNVNYTLYFQYKGYIGYNETGLFSRGCMTDQFHKVILTQMDPVYARRVFPCFDEPAFKAKFELHIGRPSGYKIISNTLLFKTTYEKGNDWCVDHFDVTPIMSTYLLYFVISEYRDPGYTSDTAFFYDVGDRTLLTFNDLFEVPYKELWNEVLRFAMAPWFKNTVCVNRNLTLFRYYSFIQFIMTSINFAIFFSDRMLAHKPGHTDNHRNKELTCRAVSHELAKTWFGKSVTISWWSHLWLSVGFTTYYDSFITNKFCSMYNLNTQFVVNNLQRVLENDAAVTSLPLTSPEIEIQSPHEINEQYNAFIADKGASIIRMWRNLMDVDNFNKSIKSYLKEFHLKNVEPSDLFAHLKRNWPAQPEVDLDTFFADFTEQPGYPMVIVNISDDNQRVVLHQKRFLYDPEDGSDATLRYTIPITFCTNLDFKCDETTLYTYFNKNRSTVEIFFDKPIEWIILNLDQSNYYRVFYDKPILSKIKIFFSNFISYRLPQTSHAQIVDDLFNFAHAGMIDYADVFEFLEYPKREFQYFPWKAAYHGMERVVRRLTPQQLPHFEKYLRNITSRAFKALSVKSRKSEEVLQLYHRELQVSWLCKYQNANCNDQAKFIFDGNFEKPIQDYRETFYCAVSRTSSHAGIWRLYHNETDEDEKALLMRAIGCTRDYRTFLQLELLHLIPNSGQLITFKQIYKQNPDLVTPILETIIEDIEELS